MNEENKIEPQLIIIICVLSLVLATILLTIILLIVKRCKKKRLEKQKKLENKEIIDIDSELRNIKKFMPNSEVINDNQYQLPNNLNFKSGKILINKYGLFVINEFNEDWKLIEGDFNNREWTISNNNIKSEIKNLFWDLKSNIEFIIPILPKNVPIIGLFVFGKIKEFDINNCPEYILYSNVSDLCNTMFQIKKSLKPIISVENISKISELLKNKILK
ncbi:hypothetical protein [Metamycoplasma canadense]|uniref:NERD domain-containing protein n=1 Tax=Metamycoplasma canadense TaxID=29554 RepID=A0A077LC20_9BACT|nr:hypothetical protein [Metamycoplasma canadense]BAP39664.1 hypothetical protein MCAN360_0557 [Metamycoplasma canadense]